MKTKIFLSVMTALAMLFSLQARAYDVVIDGIYYNLDRNNGTATVTNGTSSYTGDISIPSSITYDGTQWAVTAIGYPAFTECSELTSVIIPEGVERINGGSFKGCTNLTSITIPSTMKTVGDAFYGCEDIKNVYIADLAAWCNITFENGSPMAVGTSPSLYLNGEKVTELVIPDGVTELKEGVFAGWGDIISVSIPNSVTSIGRHAFARCANLSSVKIPEGVDSIGAGAFYNCSGLTSVYIPSTLARIMGGAFSGCRNIVSLHVTDLAAWCKVSFYNEESYPMHYRYGKGELYLNGEAVTDLVIPDGVTAITSYTFSNCRNITSVTIPNSVKDIRRKAFDGCLNITAVYISDLVAWCNISFEDGYNTLGTLGASWYLNGTKVTELTIPDGVTELKEGVFMGCGSLTSVTIPNSVTSIGKWAFSMAGLTSVTIPNSVDSIGADAFAGCRSLTSVHTSSLESWCNISFEDIGSNPLSYAKSLYVNGEAVSNLVIPESVKSIGKWAFSNTGLTSVTIPNSVDSIGQGAFYNCGSLTSVHTSSLESWCNISFEDESSNPLSYAKSLYVNGEAVTDLVIPDGVTNIGQYSFSYNIATSVTIPESVKSIGKAAFYNCRYLTSVTFPYSLDSIGDYAFEKTPWKDHQQEALIYMGNILYECNGMMEDTIVIKEGITKIRAKVFRGCRNLVSVTMPNSLAAIGDSAFLDCSGLVSVEIPKGVKEIGEWAFQGCSNLLSVIIPEGIQEIKSGTFYSCSGLTSITIPHGVTSIESSAFYGCKSLKSVTIPNGVTTLRYGTFRDCSSLKTVVLPKSMRSVSNSVFAACTSLTDLYCYADSVPAASSLGWPASNIMKKATLHVPETLIDQYKDALGWKKFGNIVALPEITPMEEEAEVVFGGSITEDTDLTSVVMENVYVTLNTEGDDGYDKEEKCIVLASTVSDEQWAVIANKEVQDLEVQESFNGLIIEVPAGKGVISITVQTRGKRTLNVRVGDGEEQAFAQPERGVVEVPYVVDKDTYVYIYGAETAGSNTQRRIAGSNVENSVLIYGIKWVQGDATAIDDVTSSDGNGFHAIYTLDGRAVGSIQKGVNILRTPNGKTKKVLMK